MKKNISVAVIALVLTTLALGLTGCQSGWKFSNPFSRRPDAAKAGGPSELDELDELNQITPPPENYTSNDSTLKSEKSDEKSLAQKGKYDANPEANLDAKETKETKVALNSDTPASEKPAENFATPDYSRNYQASNPLASGVGSTADYAATQTATMDQFANANAASSNAVAQTQQNAFGSTQAPQTNYANYDAGRQSALPNPNASATTLNEQPFPSVDLATNPTPFPTSPAFDSVGAQQNYANYQQPSYPEQNNELQNQFAQSAAPQNQYPTPQPSPETTPAPYNPIAQVSGSTQPYPTATNVNIPQTPTPETPNLAYNYDAANLPSPATNTNLNPGLDSNSNPYSNVIYEPQNVSGGFAPGSVVY